MTECKYGDPYCPCQDGMLCHYEGENPMKPPLTPADITRLMSGPCESDQRDGVAAMLRDMDAVSEWLAGSMVSETDGDILSEGDLLTAEPGLILQAAIGATWRDDPARLMRVMRVFTARFLHDNDGTLQYYIARAAEDIAEAA